MTEETIFANALSKADPDQRKAYLDDACAGNPSLRHEIEALLQAHEKAGGFLARPAAEQLAAGRAQTDAATEALERNAGGDEICEENALDFLQPSTKPGALGRLGHYEVLEVLGKGGFGIVLKAFDELLHRVVAIKVMSTQLAATSPARKRFLREARASAEKVRHDNVVAIYAVEEQPIPYLVMEYIAGETLQQRLDRAGPFDTPEVLRLGQQIAAGLAAAHAMGLIHRDIKPSNILLERGVEQRVKITDFGLARAADDASLTQSGFIAGTPMYMAPEQAEGEVIDQRADFFSLGSVLYVMCSGRPPFRASTTLAVLKRVTEDTPRPIREIIPEVPEWLCAIVAKLHAKKPAERFQSAKEVTDLLNQHLAHVQQPTLAPPPRASSIRASEGQPPARRAEQLGDFFLVLIWKRQLRNLLACSLIFVPLACILWTIIWLNRDKEPPISPPGVTTPEPSLAKAPFSATEARQYQEAWAKYLGAPVENTNSADMKMVLVPPGEFLMGMTDEQVEAALKGKEPSHWLYNNYRESRPQHKVTISKPFYMAATEVTVAQFRAFVTDTGYRTEAERDGKGGTRWDDKQKQLIQEKNLLWDTPGYGVSRNMPVTQITWNDAVAYCNWLSKREALSRRYEETRESWDPVSGDGYSLPTEAEWEYACKAGTTTIYSCGNDEETLSKYAWYSKNSDGRPHPVGTKLANAFGLFDMHGNASEFCQDFYSGSYYAPLAATDPRGPDVSRSHVRRGGHWDADADAAPSALRMSLFLHDRQRSTGFRVVRELPGVSGAKIENPEPPRADAPFAVLTKDAQAERKFATLAEAVAAAQSGDTVEIQGNGPFVAAPLVLLEKRLAIRAGKGYHPVLTPSTETPKWQPFFDTNATLVLEGLEFRINGQPFALPEKNAYRYAIRTRQPLYLANCRFVAKSGQFATIRSSGSSCQLLNCQFLGADLHGALDWESSNGGKVLLKNCQQAGSIFWLAWHDDSPELNNVTVQLTDNTVLAGPPLALMLGIVPGQVEAPFRMEVSRNILQAARQVFSLSVTNEAAEKKVKGNKAEVLKQLVRWQGQQNVYGNKTDFLFLGEGAPVRSLQDWKQFWGSAEEKSQRELPSFEGGDLLKLAATDPERMEANDFRLKAGSPGKGAGPGGKDIGADADRVGPGAAYEKWKQTPEYQEWRKKTDALLGVP